MIAARNTYYGKENFFKKFAGQLGIDQNLENSLHDAFIIERHGFRAHWIGRIRILRRLGVDTITEHV